MSRALRWLLALFALAQLMDWMTTEVFLRLGVAEGNSLTRGLAWPWPGLGLLTVKLALIASVTLFVWLWRPYAPRFVGRFLAAVAGGQSGVVIYNAIAILMAAHLIR